MPTLPATLTASAPTQDPATRPVEGIVTPAAAPVEATLDNDTVQGVPANVSAWNTYKLRYIDLTIRVPPEWMIKEWPATDPLPFFYSVSIQPPAIEALADCTHQCPEISAAVWRVPVTTLEDWLEHHSTTEPFGTIVDGKPYLHFYGVTDIAEVTVGGQRGLGFSHDAMGIRIYTVIVNVGNVVVSLSQTDPQAFDLNPVFQIMIQNIIIGA